MGTERYYQGAACYLIEGTMILPELQENILFGSEFDETRYNKGMSLAVLKRVYSHAPPNSVIKQCALERDLSLFAAGDSTSWTQLIIIMIRQQEFLHTPPRRH